jgi:hypothetical protein
MSRLLLIPLRSFADRARLRRASLLLHVSLVFLTFKMCQSSDLWQVARYRRLLTFEIRKMHPRPPQHVVHR